MIDFWSYKNELKKYKNIYFELYKKSLNSGQIFFGNNLEKFEKNFIKKNNAKFGIAVGSGTDALLISLMSLDIKKGDEVITAANTAIPTISAIVNSGAIPKLVDVNQDSLIDINLIEKTISNRTRAIIPVHLYGKPCQMDKLVRLSKRYNIHLIEDCAQAQGAKFKNKFVGTFGSMGCFSFYPTKILGGYGDGGFILTNNFKLYNKIKKIRFYGIDTSDKKNKFFKKYYANINGVNSRLDEINSALLNFKLTKLNSFINKRRKIAKIYDHELKNTSLQLPKKNTNTFDVFHLYTVEHSKRSKIRKILSNKGIETRIIYPYPIHKMKAYKNFFKNKKFINSEIKSKKIFSLPLYPELETNKVLLICKELKKILNNV
jgi:dTDP-4-amino-4,6-dideoxygalactose transaminase